MRIVVLGSAAGGGLPQWNCGCNNCRAARAGDPAVAPRTQSSLAISTDGRAWFLLNVSADVRSQLANNRALWPDESARRASPIQACILTDGEIDHTSGLLQLREGCQFSVYSTPVVRTWLAEQFPVGRIVAAFADRPWREFQGNAEFEPSLADGSPSGLRIRAIDMQGDAPRYVAAHSGPVPGACVAMLITDLQNGTTMLYAPGIPALSEPLRAAADQAQCLLVDGTFWHDRELVDLKISTLTARDMGHVPISGSGGTLEWLRTQPGKQRVYVHINNTNPVLLEGSPEHAEVIGSGIRVAYDGDHFDI
ncbi:MAG TPA: pyrroloquinoline quinone biosynthesis protein PqqB [Pirellulales bacterium]|jgi:pyrroloquinoline quinone biosynthesis protein B|nr:pyrroloquinoline quinone biosynthesis protein PqqB [Pirellulales bacterium]